MKRCQCCLVVGEENGFRNLQLKARGWQPGIALGGNDRMRQRLAPELKRGKIDGDTDICGPTRSVSAGLAQDPLPNRHDQSGW